MSSLIVWDGVVQLRKSRRHGAISRQRRKRQKLFDNKHAARVVCDELRSLCPRNAKVINIKVAEDDPFREVVPTMSLGRVAAVTLVPSTAILGNINPQGVRNLSPVRRCRLGLPGRPARG
jgi:hypothetical protein